MPAFRITVDDAVIATVDTTGMAMIDVCLFSRRTWQERAMLDMAGLPADAVPGTPASLYFISSYALTAGQRVKVELLAAGATSPAGKTADELYPDEPPATTTDFSLTPAMRAAHAAQPLFHDSFEFAFTASTGTTAAATSPAGHEALSLTILWPFLDQNEASIRVASNQAFPTAVSPGTDYVREKLRVGGSLTYTVG